MFSAVSMASATQDSWSWRPDQPVSVSVISFPLDDRTSLQYNMLKYVIILQNKWCIMERIWPRAWVFAIAALCALAVTPALAAPKVAVSIVPIHSLVAGIM